MPAPVFFVYLGKLIDQDMSKDNRLSLFAGLLIGLGAYGFLALGGIPPAPLSSPSAWWA